MVSASRTARTIESTAESLQGDLDRLELQKRSLERELAAVADHLETVRRAVHALESVMTGPADTAPAAETVDPNRRSAPPSTRTKAGSGTGRAAPVGSSADARAASRPPGRDEKAGKRASRSKDTSRSKNDADRTYGKLTEQTLDYLSQVGDTDVRARDVATALGRATDSGSINAIRSTLDRLVGTSRVQRTGRGLYRAQQP
ncbi:hypothetical protein [Streptomyces phaeochromogenes]|uniref:hypothetical protein n=1 Tax=Streptomyces phaeochromogenes TaxID=1923 RepID=UPI00386915ED|nr:hypothetical protein OHB08_01005 [Streptomyces phaeochromogenes]